MNGNHKDLLEISFSDGKEGFNRAGLKSSGEKGYSPFSCIFPVSGSIKKPVIHVWRNQGETLLFVFSGIMAVNIFNLNLKGNLQCLPFCLM